MAKKGQKFNNYSKEFKLNVVEERLSGASLKYLVKKYNIPNNSMIVRWTNEYKNMGILALEDKRSFTKKQIPTKGRPKVNFDSIEQENKALRLENEYLKKQEALRKECTIEELDLWSSKNLK